MNFLASPPLVVAYALAGNVEIDLTTEPLGTDGRQARLPRDIWPSDMEGRRRCGARQLPDVPATATPVSSTATPTGRASSAGRQALRLGRRLDLREEPALLRRHDGDAAAAGDIRGARVLALLGDSVTTDHISPAGTISDQPAARYLVEHGVKPKDFNSYGARRGNHEVMVRGTFANIRLRNLVPGVEGNWTCTCPTARRCRSTTWPCATRGRARPSWCSQDASTDRRSLPRDRAPAARYSRAAPRRAFP